MFSIDTIQMKTKRVRLQDQFNVKHLHGSRLNGIVLCIGIIIY